MNLSYNTSTCSSSTAIRHGYHKRRVNWHEAAACAIEIELRDYAHLLQFYTEYILGKRSYRIDMLVVKKLSEQAIPKNIAHLFREYNLFELKGMYSSLNISAYYKTIGYAGILIDQLNQDSPLETKIAYQYSALDVSLTFLTFRYPRKLIKHLTKSRELTLEKSSEGIYHIIKETFDIQIIVTKELPPEQNLYLRCLTDSLTDHELIDRLAGDYARHQEQDIYLKYMNQLTAANIRTEGEQTMVCEGILNLCGTSSAEIIAKAKQESADYYQPKINELTASNEQLIAQVDRLKEILRQNNLSFE